MQLTQDVTWRTHPRISLKDSRGKSKPRKQTKLPGEKCLKEPPIHLIAFIFFLCHAQNNFISNVKREDEKYHHVYGQLWKHVESPLEELEVVEDAINNLTNSSNSVCWTTLYGRLDWEIHSNEKQHFTLSTCAASKKYRYCVCTIKIIKHKKSATTSLSFLFRECAQLQVGPVPLVVYCKPAIWRVSFHLQPWWWGRRVEGKQKIFCLIVCY